MKIKQDVEVMMKDGSTALARDVMDTLITSEVANTISENDGVFELHTHKGIVDAAEYLVMYFEINTHITVAIETIISEFNRQLRLN
ncbi:hypothetical protein ABTM70_01255 [Acinetobacter baumannii]